MNPEDPATRPLDVLFFARGRGRGHAVPDTAIVDELQRLNPDLNVCFASYATGAETLRELGRPVVDLDLPERNHAIETQVRAGRLIRALDPRLVVAHEEFAALPAAKTFNKPAVFVTDFFFDAGRTWMDYLLYADQILFVDHTWPLPVPPQAEGKVHYVGPILRPFTYRREDRARARRELGLGLDDLVVTVLAGSFSEDRAPIADLVLDTFELLPQTKKQLVYIAGGELGLVQAKAAGRPRVTVKEADWQMDRLIVATDIAITRASRTTNLELDHFGVPSVSLSYGLNPVDDARSKLFESVTLVNAAETDAAALSRLLSERLSASPPRPADSKAEGAKNAARQLMEALQRPPRSASAV